MALPAAHPEVDGQNAEKACPVTGKTHEYSPPTATDIRSVCPALNAMANHGYLCVCVPSVFPSKLLLASELQ
jgi:hypothetical protein